MDNQHKKISGYRDLSQAEVDLMNEIKALGPQLEFAVLKVVSYLKFQHDEAAKHKAETGVETELDRIHAAQPMRWTSIANTDFQTGLMALVRAIAQPGGF